MSTADAEHETADIGQIAEQLLGFLPVPIATIIRMGAVPHRLSLELLGLLAKEPDLINPSQRVFAQLSFARTAETGVIHYHTQFRQALRQQLRLNNPTLFAETNQKLYTFFVDEAAQSQSSDKSVYEQEAFYHLLQFNTEHALYQFRHRFEILVSTGQVNQAEQYVTLAAELRGEIGLSTDNWIDYWQARIDLLYGHHRKAQATFTELAHVKQPLLVAVSTWGCGLVHLDEDRWSSAIGTFLDTLKLLEAIDDKLYTTQVYLALGFAYQDFAEKSGGLSEHEVDFASEQAQNLWNIIEQLPFNGYAALAKRIDWLPTWNIGTNYQNWIIYYLLRQGRYWYRRAEKLATTQTDYNSEFDAQRMIAHLDLVLGRTSRAMKQYRLLGSLPQVRTSRYRTAQTDLDLGLAHLEMKELNSAVTLISRAVTTLREFHDHRSVGCGMRYLGKIYAYTGQFPEAVNAYANSINAFALTPEVLEYTTSVIALEKLNAEIASDSDLKSRISGIMESVRQRAYISRFPDRLLRLFRRVSLLVALPLSFFSAFVLTFLLVGVLFNLEGGLRLLLIGEPFDLAILRSIGMLMIVISGFLGIVWLYQLIYTVVGASIVAYSGRNLITLEREQPIYYFVDSNQLQVRLGHMNAEGRTLSIPWDAIAQLSSLVYYRWLSPIMLYSITRITLKDLSTVDISALTNHYTDLIQVIERNLASFATRQSFPFSVFRSWFSVIFIGIALLISIFRVFTRQLLDMPGYRFGRAVAEGGRPVPLWVTSVAFFFLVSLLLLFQTGLLWRLLFHQHTIHRQTRYRSEALPLGIVLFLTLLSTLLTILWGIFLYRLTAGA